MASSHTIANVSTHMGMHQTLAYYVQPNVGKDKCHGYHQCGTLFKLFFFFKSNSDVLYIDFNSIQNWKSITV